jgi:hypothetical protein
MRQFVTTLITIAALAAIPIHATIINIPDDYPTIQEGIDFSTDGDTVLVAEGRYYENMNFRGKNITVASNYILDDDPIHIINTVIDGSQPIHTDTASCLLIVSGEDSTAVLAGFTLTSGYGTIWQDIHNNLWYREGGGILIELSSPTIRNNIITGNEAIDDTGVQSAGGGGIRIGDGNPLIVNNEISFNNGLYGGGVVLNFATGIVRGNLIYSNGGGEDYGGGGVWTYGAGATILENNTIVNNSSSLDGGGLLIWSTSVIARNNIIFGNTDVNGYPQIRIRSGGSISITYSDVEEGWEGDGNIDVDPLFRDPENGDFKLSSDSCGYLVNSPCIDAGDPDIFDIYYGCDRGLEGLRSDMGAYGGGDSATLDEGWVVCDIGSVHNYITNSTITQGSGSNEWTILIGDDSNEYPSMIWTVPADYAENNHYLYYAALRLGYNRTLAHLSTDTSPGIEVLEPPESISDFDTHFHISTRENDSISIRVHENTYAWNEPEADDFIIYDFWIVNTDISPLDSLYVAFYADCDISAAGGGSGPEGYWRDDLVGYYRDYGSGEFISYMYDGDSPHIDGDDEGGRYEPRESLGYLGSRLLYCPPIVGDSVPSVQQGHSWWEWENDPGYDSIWFDYMSNDIWMDPPENPEDMRYLQKTGPFEVLPSDSINIVFAFGIGEGENGLRANLEIAQQYFDNGYIPTSIDSDVPMTPGAIGLQNFPNPFNSSTIIRFGLPEKSDVRIEIYNILGQRVAIIFDGTMQPGYHSVTWQADNHRSGVYFARLEAGGNSATVKMVLLR